MYNVNSVLKYYFIPFSGKFRWSKCYCVIQIHFNDFNFLAKKNVFKNKNYDVNYNKN